MVTARMQGCPASTSERVCKSDRLCATGRVCKNCVRAASDCHLSAELWFAASTATYDTFITWMKVLTFRSTGLLCRLLYAPARADRHFGEGNIIDPWLPRRRLGSTTTADTRTHAQTHVHTHTDTRTHRQTDSYPHTWTNQRTKPDKRCHVQTTIDLVAVASAVHSILLAYSTRRPYCMLSIFRILSFLGQPICGSRYMQVRPSGRIRLVSHQLT